MKIPRPDKQSREFFVSMVPSDKRVTRKLMFGNDAAFVNGNLFFGVYGPDLFVRLPEDGGGDLLKTKGTGRFEPVPGHAMKGYYTFPREWVGRRDRVEKWVSRSLEWTLTLPAKKGKK